MFCLVSNQVFPHDTTKWSATSEGIEKARRILTYGHVKLWLELRNQGQGDNHFSKNKTGNALLEEYNLLKPSRFMDVISLRTNTFATRIVLAQADKK